MAGLKVGVIGVGHLGQHHARIYSSLPGVELVGLADLDADRGRSMGKRYNVGFYADFHYLLPHIEAVSVVVPTSAHYPVAAACLEAGLHVLVEKPIASCPSEGRELVCLARDRGRLLQVGHVERFNPIVEMIRPYVRQPGFIECHRLSPFQPRGTDVDVVLDLMIHDLDMVLSFGLGTANKVEAAGLAVLSDNLDIVNTRIEFSLGCVANFTASRVSTGRLRKLRVFQSDGYLSVDYHTREAVLHRRLARHGHAKGAFLQKEHLHGGDEEPLQRELASFIQAIQEGARPVVPGEEGVVSLELAYKVLEEIPAYPPCSPKSSLTPVGLG